MLSIKWEIMYRKSWYITSFCSALSPPHYLKANFTGSDTLTLIVWAWTNIWTPCILYFHRSETLNSCNKFTDIYLNNANKKLIIPTVVDNLLGRYWIDPDEAKEGDKLTRVFIKKVNVIICNFISETLYRKRINHYLNITSDISTKNLYYQFIMCNNTMVVETDTAFLVKPATEFM